MVFTSKEYSLWPLKLVLGEDEGGARGAVTVLSEGGGRIMNWLVRQILAPRERAQVARIKLLKDLRMKLPNTVC